MWRWFSPALHILQALGHNLMRTSDVGIVNFTIIILEIVFYFSIFMK